MKIEELTKEQLVSLVKSLAAERGVSETELEQMQEESIQNEAYMERHGRINYGYGESVYGPI